MFFFIVHLCKCKMMIHEPRIINDIIHYTFIRTVANLFGEFGIILLESSLSRLKGSYTCSDLKEKVNETESGPFFINHPLVSSPQAGPLLTGLKITSSSRVMLPFDSPPKSSFFSGKTICCPLRICGTEKGVRCWTRPWTWLSVTLDYILASPQPAGVLFASSL